jgi:hypothetical protein
MTGAVGAEMTEVVATGFISDGTDLRGFHVTSRASWCLTLNAKLRALGAVIVKATLEAR